MKKRFIIIGFICLIVLVIFAGIYLQKQKRLAEKTEGKRILACISSFNRPVFLSAQVLRMLNQTYPVDISVSIKGVPQGYARKTLLKEWEEYMKKGRVIVRFDKNRDQYSNLLDTVRNVDLNKYDYFCKIDDDDWYGPDYFKHVNEWLSKEKDDIALSYTINNYIIHGGKNNVMISANITGLFGPSMCFSRKLIKLALDLEKNPIKAEKYIPNAAFSEHKEKKEDAFLHKLAAYTGKVQERKTPIEDLSFGWQYTSVMRTTEQLKQVQKGNYYQFGNHMIYSK